MKLIFSTTVAVFLMTSPCVNANDAAVATATNNSQLAAISTDIVVARANGFEITQRAMEHVMANTIVANPAVELPPDVERRILSQLIEIQLVLQKATDAEKTESRRKNDENFTNIIKTLGEKEFERRLEATDMTANELRLMFFQENAAQTSLTRQLDIHVTDADARKFFEKHPGAYDRPEMARIRELILLTTSNWKISDAAPLATPVIEAKYRLILDLHKRALAGEDFAALARRYNEHPRSKENDNELTLVRGQMDIGSLVFSMKTNQISEVVTNDGNYCVFQLLQITPAKKAEFADVADQIKNMMIGKQKQMMGPAYIRKLWKEAGVEILDPKLKAAEAANEAARTEAEKKLEEIIKSAEAANAEAVAKIAAQFSNGSPNSKIPAPKPSHVKP